MKQPVLSLAALAFAALALVALAPAALAVLGAQTVAAAGVASAQPGSATSPQSTTLPNAAGGRERSLAAVGEPFALGFHGSLLAFCDRRGGRQLDLTTGAEGPRRMACPANDEPNTACAGLKLDVAVHAPLSEPNDVVDIDGWSVPLQGRVHDCAEDGKLLAVVTASSVVLLDAARQKTRQLDRQGGDRVAVGPGWVAWSNGPGLRVTPR